MQEHRTFCRICAAACGVLVSVDREQVVRIRGDAEHPVSRGYTCSKGRALGEWHHRADRLDRPRLRGAEAGWDAVLDDLASALSAIGADPAHGRDAVAMYLATGFAYDSAGQVAAAMWMGAVGSSSFFTAATVDNAPVLVAAELVAGHPMLNPVWDPSVPGVLVLVGSNPVVSHGYGTTLPDPVRYLRDYRRAGGRIWVLDPRRTESAALADHHLPVRPGADVEVLAWLANELVASSTSEHCAPDDLAQLAVALAPFSLARAAEAAGIAEPELLTLLADVRRAPGRVAVFCGTGVTMSPDGILAEWLRWVVLALTDSLDREGGMRFNRGAVNRLRPSAPAPSTPVAPARGPRSRPELPRVAGQVPAAALVDEIEAGNVRALVVTGGNPLAALPEPDRTRRALASLEVLAVVDVLDTELTALATHVLPAAGQLERADLTLAEHVALRSGVQATRAVVPLGAERRPAWWIMGSLARRMGCDALMGADPDALTDEAFLGLLLARSPVGAAEVFAAGSHGCDIAVEHGWVTGTMLPSGTWNLAPPVLLERLAAHRPPPPGLLLTTRREMAWSNSVRYAGPGDEPLVHLHPDDARALGLDERDRVVVRSAHGSLRATVRLEPTLRPGVVSCTHGRAGSSPGSLTSSVVGVDALTTMPHASALPVTLLRDSSTTS